MPTKGRLNAPRNYNIDRKMEALNREIAGLLDKSNKGASKRSPSPSPKSNLQPATSEHLVSKRGSARQGKHDAKMAKSHSSLSSFLTPKASPPGRRGHPTFGSGHQVIKSSSVDKEEKSENEYQTESYGSCDEDEDEDDKEGMEDGESSEGKIAAIVGNDEDEGGGDGEGIKSVMKVPLLGPNPEFDPKEILKSLFIGRLCCPVVVYVGGLLFS